MRACLFGVYDVLREPDEWLRARFGTSVAQLVADLRQLMKLSELTRKQSSSLANKHGADEQAEAAAPDGAWRWPTICESFCCAWRRACRRCVTTPPARHPDPQAIARETMRLVCAAREPARHMADEVGAGRPVVSVSRARDIQGESRVFWMKSGPSGRTSSTTRCSACARC